MFKLYSIFYYLFFPTYMYNFILFILPKRNSRIFFQNSESAQTFYFGSQMKMGHKSKLSTMTWIHPLSPISKNHS